MYMDRTYSVLFKNGQTQIFTGNIVLFSIHKLDLPRSKNAICLNASEVLSIVEISNDEETL